MFGWPGETITIRRQSDGPTGEDSQGNPVFGVSEAPVDGCVFAPRGSDESNDATGPRVITGGTVYAPAGTDIRYTDKLVIRGDVFVVDGEVGEWVPPFPTAKVPGGVEVAVKRGA